MAIASLLNILVSGWILGIRRKPITRQTLLGVFLIFFMIHLISGVFLAITGIERPKVEFKNKRSV
ncbi:MAG: hypothetical protein WCI18_06945 [Pseudomonadota bacterium]